MDFIDKEYLIGNHIIEEPRKKMASGDAIHVDVIILHDTIYAQSRRMRLTMGRAYLESVLSFHIYLISNLKLTIKRNFKISCYNMPQNPFPLKADNDLKNAVAMAKLRIHLNTLKVKVNGVYAIGNHIFSDPILLSANHLHTCIGSFGPASFPPPRTEAARAVPIIPLNPAFPPNPGPSFVQQNSHNIQLPPGNVSAQRNTDQAPSYLLKYLDQMSKVLNELCEKRTIDIKVSQEKLQYKMDFMIKKLTNLSQNKNPAVLSTNNNQRPKKRSHPSSMDRLPKKPSSETEQNQLATDLSNKKTKTLNLHQPYETEASATNLVHPSTSANVASVSETKTADKPQNLCNPNEAESTTRAQNTPNNAAVSENRCDFRRMWFTHRFDEGCENPCCDIDLLSDDTNEQDQGTQEIRGNSNRKSRAMRSRSYRPRRNVLHGKRSTPQTQQISQLLSGVSAIITGFEGLANLQAVMPRSLPGQFGNLLRLNTPQDDEIAENIHVQPNMIEPQVNIEVQENTEAQPVNLELQQENVELQPVNIELQPQNVELQPENVELQPVNIELAQEHTEEDIMKQNNLIGIQEGNTPEEVFGSEDHDKNIGTSVGQTSAANQSVETAELKNVHVVEDFQIIDKEGHINEDVTRQELEEDKSDLPTTDTDEEYDMLEDGSLE